MEGEGKYGTLEAQTSKAEKIDPDEYLGGMRNPFEATDPTCCPLECGFKAAWEAFTETPRRLLIPGTKDCQLDQRLEGSTAASPWSERCTGLEDKVRVGLRVPIWKHGSPKATTRKLTW